jgi:acetyl-CoA acetyltransferase family protein
MAAFQEAWIVGALRTPIGRLGGALSSVRPDDLAARVLREIIERAGIPTADVEDVILGCANQAGEDNRNVARMASLLADLPVSVPGTTVNRLCGSGLEAVAVAARALMVGDGDLYLAGGVESMSRAPWAVPKPTRGFATGSTTMYDTSLGWRFVNSEMERRGHTEPLGITAENLALERYMEEATADRLARVYDASREAQDRFALASHQKAVAAAEDGRFDDEIVSVTVARDRDQIVVVADECPRSDTSPERLGALRPAFRTGGTVTAGNSSPLSDGAAALLLASPSYALRNELQPLGRVRAIAVAGVPPRVMGIGPVPATAKVLGRSGLTLEDIGLIELNEAFAAQSLAVFDGLGVEPGDRRVNVNGGAIALGHPLGCSGARILTTLVHEMQRRPAVEHGLASMCVGVGQGISVIVDRVD